MSNAKSRAEEARLRERAREASAYARDAGYYWVRDAEDGWLVARWEQGECEGQHDAWWSIAGDTDFYQDGRFVEIGPKLEPPDEHSKWLARR